MLSRRAFIARFGATAGLLAAGVAQSAELLFRKQPVAGSSPALSSTSASVGRTYPYSIPVFMNELPNGLPAADYQPRVWAHIEDLEVA